MKIKLEIVTPEAKTFSDDVDMVTLTGGEGEMGILPRHMPLMTQMVAGEVTALKDHQSIFLAVGVLRWPMVPVVLVVAPLSIALAFFAARRGHA